jgi:hypothetical protein
MSLDDAAGVLFFLLFRGELVRQVIYGIPTYVAVT